MGSLDTIYITKQYDTTKVQSSTPLPTTASSMAIHHNPMRPSLTKNPSNNTIKYNNIINNTDIFDQTINSNISSKTINYSNKNQFHGVTNQNDSLSNTYRDSSHIIGVGSSYASQGLTNHTPTPYLTPRNITGSNSLKQSLIEFDEERNNDNIENIYQHKHNI